MTVYTDSNNNSSSIMAILLQLLNHLDNGRSYRNEFSQIKEQQCCHSYIRIDNWDG